MGFKRVGQLAVLILAVDLELGHAASLALDLGHVGPDEGAGGRDAGGDSPELLGVHEDLSSAPTEKIHSLADYAGFLADLKGRGFEFVVIGGCAVGSYARLFGKTVLSGDLDIYAAHSAMDEILEWGRHHELTDIKRPQPRSIPTAFLKWRGLEVNILTGAFGLPPAEDAIRTARHFSVAGVDVPLVDPFDLLNNKLKVNRPKDRPHIEIMMQFVEEEVVAAFESETDPRERLAPARRLLRVLKRKTLAEPLAERLVALARTPADFRFLVNSVPLRTQAEAVLARGGDADELRSIVKTRRFA